MRFIAHIALAALLFSAPLQSAEGVCAPPRKPERTVRLPELPPHSDGSFMRRWFPFRTEDAAVRPPLETPRRAKLLFAGDVMQHMPQVEAARQADGSYDYTASFQSLRPLFGEASLAVVNLETTLAASGPYTGYPCFRSPIALADGLKELGTDVCMLATNHCCDGGAQGVRTTLAALDRCGIARTGVFADSTDYRTHHPLRVEAGGLRVAFLNYTYGTNGIPAPEGIIVNYIDTAAMARDLHEARNGTSDVVVVFVHWGSEYERLPNLGQRELAGFLHRHGTDIVVGSHPHVVQPFEAAPEEVTFYSLGNFVSNQRKRYCDGGIVAEVAVTLRPGRPPVFDAKAVPVWVLLPAYRILPPEAADTLRMPAWMRTSYDRFRSDTHELLGNYR